MSLGIVVIVAIVVVLILLAIVLNIGSTASCSNINLLPFDHLNILLIKSRKFQLNTISHYLLVLVLVAGPDEDTLPGI